MNIDCRDCGPEWCAKHVPVTVATRCPGYFDHAFVILSEDWGWCRGSDAFRIWHREPWADLDPMTGPRAGEWFHKEFPTYQELSDWFIANVEVIADA